MLKRIGLFILCGSICYFVFAYRMVKKREMPIIESKEKAQVSSDDMQILMLKTSTGEVVKMPLEDYMKGVVCAEMPINFELEALKAQAIVARTYALFHMKYPSILHPEADVCDSIECCQAFSDKEEILKMWSKEERKAKWNKLCEAVDSTRRKVITYDGQLIEAFFHSHSGGKTEDVKYLWNEEEIPYLKSVNGMEKDLFIEEKRFTKTEIKELLQTVVPGFDDTSKIQIIDYTPSGRVYHVKVGNQVMKATEIRSLLNLRSTNFKINEDEQGISFSTIGYGHGVGMSQYGANQMALDGKKAEEIIHHYYQNVKIEKSF